MSERTDASDETPYPAVAPRADYPAIERRILQTWSERDTFARSIENRPADGSGPAGEPAEYVFYDGPPFANGLPHYGHLLTGYVKDAVPRYQTMRGRRVERRFGWDTHGLPVEMEVEKELSVQGRAAITEYGIESFNEHCRTSVLRYTKEWEAYVTRQARWVDFENDYKTMDIDFMESVMWAFKQLYDKGLLYESYRVMPYSWGAETPLSNMEIRLDDATRPRQDPALTVSFTLVPEPDDPGPMKILAWTTTPWTLPSNLAVAVGPDIDYAILEEDGVFFIIGEAAREKYAAQLDGTTHVRTVKGRELVGRTYEPMLPYFADTPNAFRVLAADWVEVSDGTGVVHIAPGFGEDDQKVGEENDIALVVPVDDSGRFTDDVPEWAGENVLEANSAIIAHLKALGVVLRHDSYTHNYPHCWRTDTPIIYRALNSWYVRVTDFRDRMVENNEQINWIPEHIRDGQFGKWLEGARDWSISRNRFWGAPIPVWKSDDPAYPRVDVYGSLDELEADFGVRPTNLHRPFIDELVRPNPDDPTGTSMMRRVPEVLDCWFESGSMPYAQVHYPFENRDWFDSHFPGDFIVEYVPQTRGWFYTLHVLATALFDRPAFRNVICHGTVLDEDGRKLSKRLRNYPDPEEVFETHGSDALRWFLLSSPILRGLDFRIDRDGAGIAEVVRLVLNPIWNAYNFFTLYANADGYRAVERTDSTDVLDRYILAKTHDLVASVTGCLDEYDLASACAEVRTFLDALNNWYIRRSRDRFWAPADSGGDEAAAQAKRDAYDTLYTVLTTLTKVTAPLLPMLAEEIYTGLTREESVHLTDWPAPDSLPADPELVRTMDRIRDITTAALSLREDHGLRTRLPLARLTVAGHDVEPLAPFVGLLRDEVNVKAVELSDDLEAFGSFVLKPNPKVLGPKLGGDVQKVMKAARAGEWTSGDGGTVVVAGHTLADDEFDLALESREGEATAAVRSNDALVNLDLDITPALAAEGTARDLVRALNDVRKTSGCSVSDRVTATVWLADATARQAAEDHRAMIAGEILADELTIAEPGAAAPDHAAPIAVEGGGAAIVEPTAPA